MCCLDVRSSTPNHLVLIESGFLPVKALILCRQYKFYKRFVDCIQLNSLRHRTFRHLLQYQTRYIKHYESIITKYSCTDDILNESRNTVKSKVYQLADKGRYKFSICVDEVSCHTIGKGIEDVDTGNTIILYCDQDPLT